MKYKFNFKLKKKIIENVFRALFVEWEYVKEIKDGRISLKLTKISKMLNTIYFNYFNYFFDFFYF